MQRKEFVIGIVDHPLFGWILVPYIVIVKPNHGFYHIEAKISQLNISRYIEQFSDKEKQLASWIEEYSDQNLHKVFCKKKGQSVVDFISKIKPEFANEYIRPFIEKRLIKCTDLLQSMDIGLYYKEKPKYINSDEQVEIKRGYAQAIFNINKLEAETQYNLSIRHQNKELNLLEKSAVILTQDPCRIIIENKLFVFNDINAKKVLPFFNKECIHIPKSSEKKWFETFALETIKHYKVKPKGFEINQVISSKKAELTFDYDLQGNPTLILYFIYNEQVKFLANKGSKSSVRFESDHDNYTFYQIERNQAWENGVNSYLCKPVLTGDFKPLIKMALDYWNANQADKAVFAMP